MCCLEGHKYRETQVWSQMTCSHVRRYLEVCYSEASLYLFALKRILFRTMKKICYRLMLPPNPRRPNPAMSPRAPHHPPPPKDAADVNLPPLPLQPSPAGVGQGQKARGRDLCSIACHQLSLWQVSDHPVAMRGS